MSRVLLATRSFRAAALVACLALIAHCSWTTPSRAESEEFSTFDVEAQEADDESLLDHYLARFPREWREDWERAPQAIRTSQGCLTSGEWFIDTDLKLRAPLGRRARFALDVRQSESDAVSYETFDFWFLFPGRYGTPGVMFRPSADKSRQDFAVCWQAGTDTSAHQLRLVFTLEDMFNNLWAFRQTAVGHLSEPYERHPYEPALGYVTRHSRWRAEVGGKYLTPSRKRVNTPGGSAPTSRVTLWGTLAHASIEAQALGLEWQARTENEQAFGTERPTDLSDGDHHDFRRRWSAEVAVRRVVCPRLTAECHWLYQERTQNYGPPIGPSRFGAVDRLVTLETTWAVTPRLGARVGGMFDRITIAHTGTTPVYSYGTRNESRAYIGVMSRFGRVRLHAVEGIELDPEPYDVWLVHDKGFAYLQASF